MARPCLLRRARRAWGDEAGRLSLAVVPAILESPEAARILRRFRERQPAVRIEVSALQTVEQWEALRHGRAQFGFLYHPPEDGHVACEPLWRQEIVFPAGILQPPAFALGATDAVNYGAIGVVIGHEISQGFDDQGAQFDAQGRLRNWWTETDLKAFQRRGQCVVDQFEGYFIEPGIHHDGRLVLGEAIGELAGARIAFAAFQKALRKRPEPPRDGFTPEQQFFIAWGSSAETRSGRRRSA